MKKSLEGKAALVCGGSDGLGYGTAVELAKLGCEIILVGRSEEKLLKKLAAINTINKKSNTMMVADFNNLDHFQSALEKVLSNKAIHILINNCGGPPPGKLMEAKLEELSTAFQLHVLTSHMISQLVVPTMKQANYGRIINIVSTSVRQPIMGLGVSNTIRGAIGSWSKTLALELAEDGITVNNILPGTTKTGRLDGILASKQRNLNVSLAEAEKSMLKAIPMGRFAEVEEVSKTIAFLASPDASYITGVNLQVDGGKIKSI